MTVGSDRLTHGQVHGAAFDRARILTAPGMASWAGAKDGKTCRECNYWKFDGYTTDGIIKMAQCLKAVAMLNNKYSMRVPHYAGACKYFDEAAQPPSPIKVK